MQQGKIQPPERGSRWFMRRDKTNATVLSVDNEGMVTWIADGYEASNSMFVVDFLLEFESLDETVV